MATVRSVTHMAIDPGVLTAMEEAERRVPANVRALKRHFGVSDTALGSAFGTTRQTINGRLTKSTRLKASEVAGFARFFRVPEGVLYLTENEVIRWCLDHPEAGPDSVSATRVLLESAGQLVGAAA